MIKASVIQEIIDRRRARTYLEIGMGSGADFLSLKAAYKVAMEPNIEGCNTSGTERIPSRWYGTGAKCYKCTSDVFFARGPADILFDVVFIDGLHTYEQSLRDVMNSLARLNENGVIIMHDCNPPSETAAYPEESYCDAAASLGANEWLGPWCGDVWKTICHLRSRRRDLRVFVLDCDFGLGVVTRGEAESCLKVSPERLKEMTYRDLANDRMRLLNLREEDYLFEFLAGPLCK